jgi:alpha-mannosidase/mannosylglycerate hydrolase
MVRSETFKPMVVTHEVTLRQDSEAIEVRTVVDNCIRDHRLRVLMPSSANADTYLADQAFDVVERPIALRADNARYRELEVETKPQQTWTAVHDEKRGLAVVSTGLPESAVRDQKDRPIALTLLRSFIRAVMTSGQEGGEIQGRHEFCYLIVPLAGQPDVTALCREGQRVAAGVRTVQLVQRDVAHDAPNKPARELPPTHSFCRLESDTAVVTAIHRRSDAEFAAVRMFNPTGADISAGLAIDGVNAPDELTDLEGKTVGKPEQAGSAARITVGPKQIVTVRVKD